MKPITLLIVIVFAVITGNAQLTNTKWKGTLSLDSPTDVIFDFKKDTVTVSFVSDNSMVEEMVYNANDSSFTLQKVWGQSDCSNESKGEYHYEIKEGVMYIRTLVDDCNSRSMYLNGSKWVKM